MWQPDLYLQFGNERLRPSQDLIGRIPDLDPKRIVDLGCGPGTSTSLLRARWPHAEIAGVDSSASMLDRARQNDASVAWLHGDIAAWEPAEPVDLIFSNAALHWLKGHRLLIPRLAACGRLAIGLLLQRDYHELCTTTIPKQRWKN